MKKIYTIQWNTLVLLLLPTPLRSPAMQGWLQALLWPVVQLHRRLLAFVGQTGYQLTITPQVCWLNRLLNDRFDNNFRRIYITDSLDKDPVYAYLPAEQKPIYLGSTWLYTNGEAGELKNDFIIHVPPGLVYDEAEMRACTNQYKLAGTQYSIQTTI